MEITWIGLVVGIAGILLLRRSSTAILCFMLFCTLLGGGAAFILPALGGTSIPPASFALLFMIASLTMAGFKAPVGVIWSVKRNIYLLLFVLYGVIGAYAFPKLFIGQIELAPMRTVQYLSILQGEPLRPSPQNTTQAVYLMGTLITAICVAIVTRREQRIATIVKAVVWVSWIHIGFGLLDLVLNAANSSDLLDVFRNGTYGQVSQDLGNFHRIAGIFPEPSSYATYAFGLFAVTSELWLRNVQPRLSGATATALMLIILASTSSTGIVSVGLFAPILAARILFVRPPELAVSKALGFGGVAAMAMAGGLFVMVIRPDFAQAIQGTFTGLIFGKADTLSGVQRAFWARQGFEAFLYTGGIGVGPGSFRSSSMIPAMLGSVGIFGTTCFILHAWRLWNPLGALRREGRGGESAAVSAAFGWAAVAGLIASVVSAGSPDPGLLFAICSGVALGYAAPGQARIRAARGLAPMRLGRASRRRPDDIRRAKPAEVPAPQPAERDIAPNRSVRPRGARPKR